MVNRVNIGAKGTKLDYDNWGVPVTHAVNDHDTAIIALQNPASVIARRVANQQLPNASFTPVQCDTEDYDNANFFAPTSAAFTLPFDGRYLINAGGIFAQNGTGVRFTILTVNGGELFGGGQSCPGTAVDIVRQSVSAIVPAVAGTIINLRVYQSSGGLLDYQGRVAITFLGR